MTETIRIGQMADLHLGHRQYGKYERAIDFFDAAADAAEILAEQDPDLVLVPGDIFHRSRPYPVDQRHSIRVFDILREKDIPVYATRGNHDASYAWSKRQGGNELHVLQDLGLLTYLEDEFREVSLSNGLSVRVWGLGYYGNDTSAKLKALVEENEDVLENSDMPNILLMHAYLDNMIPSAKLSEYTLDVLGFDYVAIGHYHGWWMNGSETICCSGSTEHVSAAEWDSQERSVAVATLTKKSTSWESSIERFNYAVRPKKRKKLELGTVTITEASEAVSEVLQELDEDHAIIRIDVTGKLSEAHESLDIRSLTQEAKKAFHVTIEPEMDYAGLPVREDVSDTELMEEVFVQRMDISEENAGKWVSLADNMKDILTGSLDDKAESMLLEMLYDFADDESIQLELGEVE
ncbi:MAG: metallophosphoesterase family protein [Promethearchaeia archaeon]